MLFRRGGHTHDRRRRVLSDTLATSAPGGQAQPWLSPDAGLRVDPGMRSSNYGDAAFLDAQPRPTDFVPTRLLSFAILLLLGGGTIAGLETLHWHRPRVAEWAGGTAIAAFDLTAPASLATWFSSILLASAALAAVLVYSVRRFRADDYRGHYRVWLWAASCWLLLSIDTTAGMHHALAVAMVSLTGTRLMGDGSIWWVIAYAFLLGGVGTRLLVDMRCCRLSTGTLMLAFASYAAAVAVQFGWLEVPQDIDPAMAIQGAVLAGNLLVLLAMGLHARHVILDARGLLPGKAWADDEDDEVPSRGRTSALPGSMLVSVHPPHGVPTPSPAMLSASRPAQTTPVFTPVGLSAASSPASALGGGWPNGPVQRRLTRQEKKALRERLDRMRRDRQARAG